MAPRLSGRVGRQQVVSPRGREDVQAFGGLHTSAAGHGAEASLSVEAALAIECAATLFPKVRAAYLCSRLRHVAAVGFSGSRSSDSPMLMARVGWVFWDTVSICRI